MNIWRQHFPFFEPGKSETKGAYLDSAATTQRLGTVLEAMDEFNRCGNANVHRGTYKLSETATDSYDQARKSIAKFVGANSSDEIVFTKGCTESINFIAATWGRKNIGSGDRILISEMEHHANIVPWQVLAQEVGADIQPIRVSDRGEIDLGLYENQLKVGKPKLVAIKHICNTMGTINPVEQMSELAHRYGATIVVDGAQGLAHLPLDLKSTQIDFYAMAPHKAYGPMGFGAFYGRLDLLESMPPYQTGGGMIHIVEIERSTYAPIPEKFEAGTPNVPGAIGFGVACDWLGTQNFKLIKEHHTNLRQQCLSVLAEIKGIRIIGEAERTTGIVSFAMEGVHPHDIGTILDHFGVAVRTGHHCCQPLMKRFGIGATTRVSFGLYSTPEELELLSLGLKRVVEVFR